MKKIALFMLVAVTAGALVACNKPAEEKAVDGQEQKTAEVAKEAEAAAQEPASSQPAQEQQANQDAPAADAQPATTPQEDTAEAKVSEDQKY
ncbi:hypothetical protein [Moraxella sp.]|uniref:hypothetical protein n=1 Tax=Moraxella sp. TaxID=479 RepID=UPI0026DB4918|nr:hypothetical protein [Moraxella sp.]MDO4894378.1 hypothetical protein [Moraxella sp.]